jgi:hypothetical protein
VRLDKKVVGGIGLALAALALAIRRAGAATKVKLSNFNITPALVYPGGDVAITILATNNSNLALLAEINLGGDFVSTGTITLAPGESRTVSFTVTPSAEGIYHVAIDGLSGSFICAAAPYADIRVENLIISPDNCYVGDTVVISVKVSNYGNAPGTKTITCTIGG